MKHIPLTIDTLSPVSIGSGIKLSPYSDYIIEDKTVYYINHELVQHALSQKTTLIDEYVNGITTGMNNNKSGFNLSTFYTSRLKFDYKSTSIKKLLHR
ncbi:hypothetical protein [Paraflavitalea speifideaquila]|uniref:hypothetical protein n=1 Tax=Paraflavitalea speifideaquila TaxID=3076558 RepID=UPI0028E189DB|nr:hypothetical protein [Paraflavitalea speifideiaquila]